MTGGARADLEISVAGEDDAQAWDDFVLDAPTANFFQRWGWSRVVRRAYGYKPVYLAARQAGEIVGVLPMVDVKSPLLGRNLISTAFTVGGGVLASEPAVAQALAQEALEEGGRRRAGYVELRGDKALIDGWETKSSVYAGFVKAMPADHDACLKEVPRKRRAELRKAIAAHEKGELSVDYDDDADRFYPLYAAALRAHGTPIFPKRFVDAIMDEFRDDVEVMVVRADGEPVLSLLTFYGAGRASPYYFGAEPGARARRAFDLAIWLTIRKGIEKGFELFDFGRSKYGTGSFDYKTYWGFEPTPLEYQYGLITAKTMPDVNPKNPKFAMVSKAWTRLPLPVANLAGPILARHLA